MEACGVKVHRIGPTYTALCVRPGLAGAVDRLVDGVDIVHVHALWEDVQFRAADAARRQGKPYVITPHGMLTSWSWRHSAQKKRVYWWWRGGQLVGGAARLHFTTAMEAAESARFASRSGGSIIEPIGIDPAEFLDPPPRGEFRRSAGIEPTRPMIVFLGRIHPGKGLEYLVPAMARMRGREAVLVVVGPDSESYRATVEARIRAEAVQARVIFSGHLSGRDRLAALADADVFCLPSDHENFGLAVVESMAVGTPVVISDRVAIHAEVVESGGGTVSPREPAALAAALDQWLSDPAARVDAGKRARSYALQRYAWPRIAERWAAHYAGLIDAAAVGAR
jgi:glycosyltransferase involved in cell wall biosynthesis